MFPDAWLLKLRDAARTMVDSAFSQSWYDEEGIIKYIVDEVDWHDFVGVLAEIERLTQPGSRVDTPAPPLAAGETIPTDIPKTPHGNDKRS